MKLAAGHSSNGRVIIEKYMGNTGEVQVTYFAVGGRYFLVRLCDSYSGTVEQCLDRVVHCAVSPSRHTEAFLRHADTKLQRLFQGLGILDGPVFMQGFMDGDTFRPFDPGRRFPGVEYDLMLKRATGVDFMQMLVEFAVTGRMPCTELPSDLYMIGGCHAAVLFPTMGAGTVGSVSGLDPTFRRFFEQKEHSLPTY